MSKRQKSKPVSPSLKLEALLNAQHGVDHTHQVMADTITGWLASISSLPISSNDVHVTLGSVSGPMVIAIDRVGTELAEALAAGSIFGSSPLVEPNVGVIGKMVFTAASQRIDSDPQHVSSLRMQIYHLDSELPRPALTMVESPIVGQEAATARTHPDALTIAYMAMGANKVIQEPAFRGRTDGGELEFIDKVIEHALLLDTLADDQDFVDVFLYEVAEPYGAFLARMIRDEGSVCVADAKKKAEEMIAAACGESAAG